MYFIQKSTEKDWIAFVYIDSTVCILQIHLDIIQNV